MPAERILFVEDDEGCAALVSLWLSKAGYSAVEHAPTGAAALEAAAQRRPAMVLLDWGLPDQNGAEVCRKLRSLPDLATVPVILFTGHKREKVQGLECGADYFVGKSDDPSELLATIEAAFRKRRQETGVLEKGDMTLRAGTREFAWRGAAPVELTPKAFALLHVLLERSPEPVSREDLYRLVEGVENPGLSRALDVLLNRLKKALPPDVSARIVAVKNFGYCLLAARDVTRA
jgi:DNA-binding response OmpR family regulator